VSAEEVDRPVRVTGTIHTGFQVSDLEKSLRFYRDLLGFEVTATRVARDTYLAELVGYPGVELHVAFLRFPASEHILELLEYRNVTRQPVDTGTANPGTAHVCVSVDDLRAVHRTLRGAGVEFVSDPVLVTSGANKGRIAVYAKDPDGIRVEFLQLRPVEEAD
jgi:catechol 2,3-dioxygenase-like lactoylglutathione lyase family enzyme